MWHSKDEIIWLVECLWCFIIHFTIILYKAVSKSENPLILFHLIMQSYYFEALWSTVVLQKFKCSITRFWSVYSNARCRTALEQRNGCLYITCDCSIYKRSKTLMWAWEIPVVPNICEYFIKRNIKIYDTTDTFAIVFSFLATCAIQ